MLDGAAKVDGVVAAVAEDDQPAAAITDHGNMYGVIPFYKAAKAAGIKPIIGSELYQARDHRTERITSKGKVKDGGGETEDNLKQYYHITTLAETNEGYQNLIQLSSKAYLEGYYKKPKVDWELLEQHSRGIIATTGCLGGHVLQELLNKRRGKRDNYNAALAKAARLQDIFGKDNLFIEIQDHGLEEQTFTNPSLMRIAKKLNAPLVATNDSHYVHKHDAESHGALLCQPPGTKVLRVTGTTLAGNPRGSSWKVLVDATNIEDIRVGDRVVSWSGKDRKGRVHKLGNYVTQVGSRQYLGELIKVNLTSGEESRYTDDHICIVRLDSDPTDGNYVTYIMRQGSKYRIGSTQFQRIRSKNRPGTGVLGLIARAKEQNADAIWALTVHKTKAEANQEELFISQKFGIPTWSFYDVRKSLPRTDYYKPLWERTTGECDLEARAKNCISSYNRKFEYPFWDVRTLQPGQRRTNEIRACNLLSGMLMCAPGLSSSVHTYAGSGAWQAITVSRENYSGDVYSIDVSEDHTYIADGIVTHNCVQTGSRLSDPDRFKFTGEEHYIKTAEEMRYLFREVEVACDNTLLVAERCNVEIDFHRPSMPEFPLPIGFNDYKSYLHHLTFEGAVERWGQDLPDEVIYRLGYELDVISNLGLESYFLVVWDLIRHAKENGIRTGAGRGSAAGSAVAYSLGVTNINPIKYDLLFERFLNPDRVSMADIDMDFDSRYRDHMINYAAQKYGRDHVAQIITFSTIKARAAVQDAARVLGYEFDVGRNINRLMPKLIAGRSTPLHACFELKEEFKDGYGLAKDLRELYNRDPDTKKVIDVALGLEDLRRQDGIHAAAVIITKDPLTDYVPIQRKNKVNQDPEEAPIVTQYEATACDDLGLLKMDFLALRNLDVITDTLKHVKSRQGVEVDIDELPLEDGKTFDLLQSGHAIGVFQLESKEMRNLMKLLEPNSLDDVAALVALYRPGPMAANMHKDYADRKTGRKPVTYYHPDLEDVLSSTYGLMIYQESIMKVAQKMAGYSLAEADMLRKAMGKKDRNLIAAERDKFVQGCIAQGYGTIGHSLFDIMEPFADYAFNASHAYSYGFIAYQTAYLKAHYPVEYMAALLTSVIDKSDKLAIYLNECRRMQIPVLVPDINKSGVDFAPTEDGAILFAMAAVRDVGQAVSVSLVEEYGGPYSDFHKFIKDGPMALINKKALGSLINAGAFDSLGHSRKGLLSIYEDSLKKSKRHQKDEDNGVMTLFDVFEHDVAIPLEEFSREEKMAKEKEVLGVYVSDHPLIGMEGILEQGREFTIGELVESKGSAYVSTTGMVSNIQKKITKKGDWMATFNLEDLEWSVEAVVFPKDYPKVISLLNEDSVVWVKGRMLEDNNKLSVSKVKTLA